MKNFINKVINADCLEILKLIPNNSIDLILTDPPYWISQKTKFHRHKTRKSENQMMDFWNWDICTKEFTNEWIKESSRVLKYWWNFITFTDWKKIWDIVNAFESNWITPKRLIHYQKSNPVPFNRDRLIVNTCEYAIWWTKQETSWAKSKWTFNRQNKAFEDWVFIYPAQRKINHTTPKPVWLMEDLIKIFYVKNQKESIVLTIVYFFFFN